jgi:penicillin-binding protein 1A
MWMSYMGKALKDVPKANDTTPDDIVPNGIVMARINPVTGFREEDGEIMEYFLQENLPPEAGSNFGDLESFLQDRQYPEESGDFDGDARYPDIQWSE